MNWTKYERGLVKDGQSVIICIDKGKYRFWVEAIFRSEAFCFEFVEESNSFGEQVSEKQITHVLFIDLPVE